jgi:hypothetical protein
MNTGRQAIPDLARENTLAISVPNTNTRQVVKNLCVPVKGFQQFRLMQRSDQEHSWISVFIKSRIRRSLRNPLPGEKRVLWHLSPSPFEK